jgi:hypothetical protein
MFALADRGWTSAPLIWGSIRSSWSWRRVPGKKSSASFLLPAAGLILLGAIQQPLYQVLVKVGTVSITTCADIPSLNNLKSTYDNCGGLLSKPIGRDSEPGEMAIAKHLDIRSRMASDLTSISLDQTQSNLWSMNGTDDAGDGYQEFDSEKKSLRYWVFQDYDSSYPTTPKYFVAGLPADTTTGVLRQHLMRLNSSIECKEINPGMIPSPCPGDRPFTVSWESVINTDVSVCVPGDYTAFPWTLSRSRQEYMEEIYIDIKDTNVPQDTTWDSFDPPFSTSSSIRCTADTTRGYFELGNIWNNNTYGPLLEQWPSPTEMESFNDWTDTEAYGKDWRPYIPSDMYVEWKIVRLNTDATQRHLQWFNFISESRQFR